MSVPKSKKRPNPAIFLEKAKLIADVAHCYYRRFKRAEREGRVKLLIDIANKIEKDCQVVNDIVLGKSINNKELLELRETSLTEAHVLCRSLIGEISFLYRSIDLGFVSNPFKSKSELIKKFVRLTKILEDEIEILKALIKSDKDRIILMKEEKIQKTEVLQKRCISAKGIQCCEQLVGAFC